MNAPVQHALPAWLEGRESIQWQIRERVAANLAELDRQLVRLPEVNRLEVEGGWYAVLDPGPQSLLTDIRNGTHPYPSSRATGSAQSRPRGSGA